MVRGLKRKNKGLVSGELSTVVGATVTVTPTGGVKVKRVKDPLWPEDGDLVEEVTNEVAEFDVEAEEPKEKKAKKEEKQAKAPKKQAADEDSDDEMEDELRSKVRSQTFLCRINVSRNARRQMR